MGAAPRVSPGTLRLRAPPGAGRASRPGRAPGDQPDVEDPGDAGTLYCRACGAPVSHRRHAVARGGAHEHGRTNPAGLSFHFACYAHAPGVVPLGTLTAAHTWFAGYAWRLALCAGCRLHLGWEYRAPDGDGFYGLLSGALAEDPG